MPKTIRNQFDKYLTYENLMISHQKSKNGKLTKESIVKFEMKKEEYILWLYKSLKNQTYRHGTYKCFYVYDPKMRKIESARYKLLSFITHENMSKEEIVKESRKIMKKAFPFHRKVKELIISYINKN